MEFGVLGPLRIVRADRPLALPAHRHRSLLGALLLSADRPVTVSWLVDAVWGEQPVASARELVRTYIWRLRSLLAAAEEDRLSREPAGYRLRVEPGEFDAWELDRFTLLGRTLLRDGDLAGAAEAFAAAKALWRGEPYADLSLAGGGIEVEVQRLHGLHCSAQEGWIEACLGLGWNEAVLCEVAGLVARHPFREKLTASLMTACHRLGRTAEALEAYAALRVTLAAELGLDPGPELQLLHRRILSGEPAAALGSAMSGPLLGGLEIIRPQPADAPPATRDLPTQDRAVPIPLPLPVPHFAGRAEQIGVLQTAFRELAAGGRSCAVFVIDGTAGVGKTTLALHWAQQVGEFFAGGRLYINLRGFDPFSAPADTAEAVRGLLHGLGVATTSIPPDDDARLVLYHRLIAERSTLLILDNARDAAQIRPLLPRAGGCLTLVTSRCRLTGLAVSAGARQLTLGLLEPREARDLLEQQLGHERTDAEPAALDELVDCCAGLPLALTIAGAWAAALAGRTLATLADQLRDSRGRLHALETGDPATDPRAVFSWSYRQLSVPAARMFRLLGLTAVPEFGSAACAALDGGGAPAALAATTELARASLLTERGTGRFTFHDLLRAYAREQAADESEAARRAARARLADYYLRSADAAELQLRPTRDALDLPPPAADLEPECFADVDRAMAWFEREHENLRALVLDCAEWGFAEHAWKIAWCFATYLQRRGHWSDWDQALGAALDASIAVGDGRGRLHALRGLARLRARFGSFDAAERHLADAFALAAELDDRLAHARVLADESWVHEIAGRNPQALHAAQQALQVFRELGHEAGQAESLNNVGWYLALAGEYHSALAHCEEALQRLRALGHRYGEAGTLDSIGFIHQSLGDHRSAVGCYRLSAALYRALHDQIYEAGTIERLGDVLVLAEQTDAAIDAWRCALSILESLGHPDAGRVRTKLADRQDAR